MWPWQRDPVLRDLAEFSGIPVRDIRRKLDTFYKINAAAWNGSAKKDSSFYVTSTDYIYDTLSANLSTDQVRAKLNRFNRSILRGIADHPGKRFLDFGAGIGVMCEIAAQLGKQVSYLELPGVVFDFARWRFRKLGLGIEMIEARPEAIAIPGLYDIIYSDAVIEHLPPAMQVEAIEAIASAINEGGMLALLIDLSGQTERDPMHFHVDIADLHHRLAAAGLKCQSGRDIFCSIWRR